MMRPFYDETTNLYWILKGRTEQGIPEHPEVGGVFVLEKAALFRYPAGQILLVCNDDFEALAYAKVLGFQQTSGFTAHFGVSVTRQDRSLTRVKCQIVKMLSDEEKISLTHYLQTTHQLMKGQT